MQKPDPEVDDLLAILVDSRRRYALYYLLSNEYVDVDGLALQIAAWEDETTPTSVDDDVYESMKISLYHNHLPQLEEHDIVEFDVRSGDIVRTDGFDAIRSTIERTKTLDEQTETINETELATLLAGS